MFLKTKYILILFFYLKTFIISRLLKISIMFFPFFLKKKNGSGCFIRSNVSNLSCWSGIIALIYVLLVYFHNVCTYVYMFFRGLRGRIANVAKSVALVKYCINK